MAPKPLKKTRTAQCFFHLKILPKNSANPRVHWRKRDFFAKSALKQDTVWVLRQFPPRPTPIDESRLFTYLYISIHDIRKNVKFLSPVMPEPLNGCGIVDDVACPVLRDFVTVDEPRQRCSATNDVTPCAVYDHQKSGPLSQPRVPDDNTLTERRIPGPNAEDSRPMSLQVYNKKCPTALDFPETRQALGCKASRLQLCNPSIFSKFQMWTGDDFLPDGLTVLAGFLHNMFSKTLMLLPWK